MTKNILVSKYFDGMWLSCSVDRYVHVYIYIMYICLVWDMFMSLSVYDTVLQCMSLWRDQFSLILDWNSSSETLQLPPLFTSTHCQIILRLTTSFHLYSHCWQKWRILLYKFVTVSNQQLIDNIKTIYNGSKQNKSSISFTL